MQIRKCERVTIHYMSEVANLNPDDFRNISIPFEGETDEEFLTYLNENIYELEEIYDEFTEEVSDELSVIWDPTMKEYSNSAWNGEDSWLESGKVNKEWTKTGGFEIIHTTNY